MSEPQPSTPSAPSTESAGTTRSTRSGPGKVLVAVYGVFALAACARAGVQIATRFDEAPLAYLLSAFAGVLYVVATITLARGTRTSRKVATTVILIELVGVLTVGTLSLLDPVAFPRATVWSAYGSGYGFVPLVLPILGLWWLWSTRPRPQEDPTVRSA
jgi:cytochrome bd-type quinol oxidase subunit 2